MLIWQEPLQRKEILCQLVKLLAPLLANMNGSMLQLDSPSMCKYCGYIHWCCHSVLNLLNCAVRPYSAWRSLPPDSLCVPAMLEGKLIANVPNVGPAFHRRLEQMRSLPTQSFLWLCKKEKDQDFKLFLGNCVEKKKVQIYPEQFWINPVKKRPNYLVLLMLKFLNSYKIWLTHLIGQIVPNRCQ